MNKPIKHHYVPQCYLKRFSSDNKVVNYFDKQSKVFGEEKIRNFCQIENLYKLSQSSDPYYIETEFFAHDNENKSGKLLSLFDRIDPNISKIQFDNNQRINLSKQILLQYIRTPKFRDIKSENELKVFYNQLTQLLKEECNFEVEEIEFRPNNIAEFHKNVLLDDYKHIIIEIASANWELIYSPEEDFYTNDNPVIIKPRIDMPVTYCDAIKYFTDIYYPLNFKIMLHIKAEKVLSSKEVSIRIINNNEFTEINYLISDKATRFIIMRK